MHVILSAAKDLTDQLLSENHSFAKSNHCAFTNSISRIFLSRFQPLIWRSRSNALRALGVSSKKTSRFTLYRRVKPGTWPRRCWFIRRRRSRATPVYRTRDLLAKDVYKESGILADKLLLSNDRKVPAEILRSAQDEEKW